VNGIASEITEEIGVFFEDLDVDAGTGEQEAQHHAGGATASYAASGLEGFGIWIFCGHWRAPCLGRFLYCNLSLVGLTSG
jgi:hypothetical protein